MITLDDAIAQDHDFLFQNYGERLPVCFVKGEGSCLYDTAGKKYIDFLSGIAVCSLGYSHTELKSSLTNQINSIIHSSNWFFNSEQSQAAELISDIAFQGKTLFSNSGTEANEAAIKCARRYGKSLSPSRNIILSFEKSFHGRTYGSMSATGQEKIRKDFDPLVPGFEFIPYNDTITLEKRLNKGDVAAVIIELIQGEGGINPAEQSFIKALSDLAKKNKTLVIIDEIQTGIGRTGLPFAYNHYDIQPDIITLAKGLGAGVPIGAMHARSELMQYLPQGAHGTTFGGNHLACSAAQVVLTEIKKHQLCEKAKISSELMNKRLQTIKTKNNRIKDIRGIGLMIGVELTTGGMPYVKNALSKGLIINCTADTVLRIIPPLTISENEINDGIDILENVLNSEV